jgi:hypothetical protein
MAEIETRETPGLRVVEREGAPAPAPASQPTAQAVIDAVTQLEANKKDVTPKGFQRRLQLAYAIFDQASRMVAETEAQHAQLVRDLASVERRSPLPGPAAAIPARRPA